MPFYLTPKQDGFNKIPELQICIAEALYDVDSIVADPGGLHQRTTHHLVNSIQASRSSDNSHLLSRFALASWNKADDA